MCFVFSVAMTITTTLLSLGTIPLWLLICDTAEPNSQDVLVPYDQLGNLKTCISLKYCYFCTEVSKGDQTFIFMVIYPF